MKNYLLLLFLLPFLQSCNSDCRPDGTSLAATEFSVKMQACPDAVLLDVRTPEEYAKGHLPAAKNVNWQGPGFAAGIADFDKSKPVFIYCLSGARSAAAAEKMRSDGFQSVLELQGGIMKWRAANLPESQGDPVQTAGISPANFAMLLQTDKLVLIDFYADWCAPCKKMAPYLDEIKTDMADRVQVMRINADDNQTLVHQLGVDALPTLLIYKRGQSVWRNAGFVEKKVVVDQLQAAL